MAMKETQKIFLSMKIFRWLHHHSPRCRNRCNLSNRLKLNLCKRQTISRWVVMKKIRQEATSRSNSRLKLLQIALRMNKRTKATRLTMIISICLKVCTITTRFILVESLESQTYSKWSTMIMHQLKLCNKSWKGLMSRPHSSSKMTIFQTMKIQRMLIFASTQELVNSSLTAFNT